MYLATFISIFTTLLCHWIFPTIYNSDSVNTRWITSYTCFYFSRSIIPEELQMLKNKNLVRPNNIPLPWSVSHCLNLNTCQQRGQHDAFRRNCALCTFLRLFHCDKKHKETRRIPRLVYHTTSFLLLTGCLWDAWEKRQPRVSPFQTKQTLLSEMRKLC